MSSPESQGHGRSENDSTREPSDAMGRARDRLARENVPNLPSSVDATTALVHDLGSLLDGTMRCITIARRLIGAPAEGDEPILVDVRRNLETASSALDRMNELLHAALQGPQLALGSALLAATKPISITEAAEHAAEVLRAQASEAGVTVGVKIGVDVGTEPAGPLYTVMLNGLKNALEAVVQCGGGTINLLCDFDRPGAPGAPRRIRLEIADDGAGPPRGLNMARLFEHGITSKPGHIGVGLSLIRSIVERAGGSVSLVRRTDRADDRRPGAVLSVLIPTPLRGSQSDATEAA